MAIAISLLGFGTTGGSPTSGGTSTSGARFAVAIAWDASQTITSVVDSKGNSYSAVGTPQADGQGGLCQWYFSAGGASGASHTVTVSFSGSAFPSISFYQVTDGAATAHSGSAQGQDSGGQPFVLTSGTMPSGNWGALALCSNNTGSDGAYSANSSTPSFTLLHSEGTVASFWTHGVSSTTSSGAGAVTPSFNRSGTAGSTTGMAILVVEESLGGGGSGPTIVSADDDTPANGQSVTITVTGAGASQGGSTLTLGGVAQSVTSWGDTSITFTASRGTNKYGTLTLQLTVGGESDTYPLTLGPQAGWSYVDVGTPETDPDLRLTGTADLASGDQIAWETASGLVEVFADGTFSADPAVQEFDFEIWTPGDGWGATATQTLLDASFTPGLVYLFDGTQWARRRVLAYDGTQWAARPAIPQ